MFFLQYPFLPLYKRSQNSTQMLNVKTQTAVKELYLNKIQTMSKNILKRLQIWPNTKGQLSVLLQFEFLVLNARETIRSEPYEFLGNYKLLSELDGCKNLRVSLSKLTLCLYPCPSFVSPGLSLFGFLVLVQTEWERENNIMKN